MYFKDPDRHKREWWELNPKLRLILCDIDLWARGQGEGPTITCLLRTQEEQDELFKEGQDKSRNSVHLYGRGADLRLFENDRMNNQLLVWVNEKYPYDAKRSRLRTLIIHSGTAEHIHIQVF